MKANGAILEACKRLDVIMASKYGEHGEHPLAYHSEWHARGVAEAARKIGQHLRLDIRTIDLLGVAAMGHDTEQLLGAGINEERSAVITHEVMDSVGGFSVSEKQLVVRGIMATVVRVESGRVLQSAEQGDTFSQVIADADLASLGKPWPDYREGAGRLLRERYGSAPTAEQRREFNLVQINFLGGHTFYLQEAQLLYPHQTENIRMLETAAQ